MMENTPSCSRTPDDESRLQMNLNPNSLGIGKLLLEDLRTHRMDPLCQGFWAIAIHRFGNLAKSIRPRPLMCIAMMAYKLANRCVEWLTGITILHTTILGRRVHIWHHSGIIINANEIGDDVVIRQNTTIGQAYSGSGRPIIESRVDIGCNAVVVGNLTIGADSRIGALCLVTESIPSNSKINAVRPPTL